MAGAVHRETAVGRVGPEVEEGVPEAPAAVPVVATVPEAAEGQAAVAVPVAEVPVEIDKAQGAEPKFMISGWVPGRFESNQMRKGKG